MRRPLPLLSLITLLAGCSAAKDAAMDTGFFADSGVNGASSAPGTLRIDVEPPAGTGSPQLLPQSILVEPAGDAYTGAELDLVPTITFSGRLTADVVRGWASAAEVPHTTEAIEATFNATVDGLQLGGSAVSGEDGLFTLSLPAYENFYAITVTPADAALAPFHFERRRLEESVEADIHLDMGIPVYGRVTDADGAGVAGVSLVLSRGTSEGFVVESAPFVTDETGWYVAYVEDLDTYTLTVVGGVYRDADTTRVIPTVTEELVVDDPEDGAAAYIPLGELRRVTVDGSVIDAGGSTIADAVVRFTSTSLDGARGTLELETASGVGDFVAYLLPGTYDVTVVPPFNVSASPRTLTGIEVGTGGATLGNVQLGGLTTIQGYVYASDDRAAAEVVVSAKQEGYGEYTWSTETDEKGWFSLSVPEGTFDTTFSPPPPSGERGPLYGAFTHRTLVGGEEVAVTLDQGVELNGAVLWEGAIVPYAWLTIYDATTGTLVGRTTSNADGTFDLRVVPVERDGFEAGR